MQLLFIILIEIKLFYYSISHYWAGFHENHHWAGFYGNYAKKFLIYITVFFLVHAVLKLDENIIYPGNFSLLEEFFSNIKHNFYVPKIPSFVKFICIFLYFLFIVLVLIFTNYKLFLIIFLAYTFSWAFWTGFYNKHFQWNDSNIIKNLMALWVHRKKLIKKFLLLYILIFFSRSIILLLIGSCFYSNTQDINKHFLVILFSMYFVFYMFNIFNQILIESKKWKDLNYNISNPDVLKKINIYNIVLLLGGFWIVFNYPFYYYATIGTILIILITLIYYFSDKIDNKCSETLVLRAGSYDIVSVGTGCIVVAGYVESTDWASATLESPPEIFESEIIRKSKFIRLNDSDGDPIWGQNISELAKNLLLLKELKQAKLATMAHTLNTYTRLNEQSLSLGRFSIKQSFLSDEYTGIIAGNYKPKTMYLLMAPRGILFQEKVHYVSTLYHGKEAIKNALEHISSNFGIEPAEDPSRFHYLHTFTPLIQESPGKLGKVLIPGGLGFHNPKKLDWETYFNVKIDTPGSWDQPNRFLRIIKGEIKDIAGLKNRPEREMHELYLTTEEVNNAKAWFENRYYNSLNALLEQKKENLVDLSLPLCNDRDEMWRLILNNPHNLDGNINVNQNIFIYKDKIPLKYISKWILKDGSISMEYCRKVWLDQINKDPSYNCHVISTRGWTTECFELTKRADNKFPIIKSIININDVIRVEGKDNRHNLMGGSWQEFVKDFNHFYEKDRDDFNFLCNHILNKPNYSSLRSPD